MSQATHTDPFFHFREKIAAGGVCIGPGISLTDPRVTDALGDSVDFIWIDLEHSLMSPEAVAGHMLAARGRHVPVLVRVVAGETAFIKPILDAGADGIIVPQVTSAAEVKRAVDDCRYPPVGTRGYGPRVPSNYGRDGGDDYVRRANEDVFTSVMIETRQAVEAIDEIVAVPGLDSIVLGPMDLSASYGLLGQVEHPTVVAALEHVIARARAAGCLVGSGMGVDSATAVRMAKRGVQWVQIGGDCGYLIAHMDLLRREVEAGLDNV
ncbi:MAG: aldolase/citrate lyase family protein [Anaerolineales bacterium]